jgi:hypothetical protein
MSFNAFRRFQQEYVTAEPAATTLYSLLSTVYCLLTSLPKVASHRNPELTETTADTYLTKKFRVARVSTIPSSGFRISNFGFRI